MAMVLNYAEKRLNNMVIICTNVMVKIRVILLRHMSTFLPEQVRLHFHLHSLQRWSL